MALELVIIARLLQEATLALEGVEVATREDTEVRVDLEEVRLFSLHTALLYSSYFSTEDESFFNGSISTSKLYFSVFWHTVYTCVKIFKLCIFSFYYINSLSHPKNNVSCLKLSEKSPAGFINHIKWSLVKAAVNV